MQSIPKSYTRQFTFRQNKLHCAVYFLFSEAAADMTSPFASLSRTLGLSTAQRGRALSNTSPQHDGDRFRNVRPRPAEGLGKTLKIMWNMIFHKPGGTMPAGALPVEPLTRAQLEAAPDRSVYRLGHSTLLFKLRGQF